MKLFLLLFALLTFGISGYSQEPDGEHNYYVIYIETNDQYEVEVLLQELRECEGKVISADYIWNNHELYVTYTDYMRNETIEQIVYTHFPIFKKVRGTHMPINE